MSDGDDPKEEKPFEVVCSPDVFKPLSGVDSDTPRAKPFHIPAECPQCNTVLVLHDLIGAEDPVAVESIWYDEWACPKCNDGIYHDWPEEAVRELASRFKTDEGIPVVEVLDALDQRAEVGDDDLQ